MWGQTPCFTQGRAMSMRRVKSAKGWCVAEQILGMNIWRESVIPQVGEPVVKTECQAHLGESAWTSWANSPI